MSETTRTMNHFIGSELSDQVFFYAESLAMDDRSYDVIVNPGACLVGMKVRPGAPLTVDDVRRSMVRKTERNNTQSYDGKILLSGGVILTINGKLLMLLRDEGAPVDPLTWTSAAGRCDREPLLTSLMEFYEEIILVDTKTGRPVFVVFPGHAYDTDATDTYCETLRNKGLDCRPEKWIKHAAVIDEMCPAVMRVVNTRFAAESYTNNFFIYYDDAFNTLELRILASLKISAEDEANLSLRDGEYNRQVRMFTKAECLGLDDDALVSAMRYYREFVWRKKIDAY